MSRLRVVLVLLLAAGASGAAAVTMMRSNGAFSGQPLYPSP